MQLHGTTGLKISKTRQGGLSLHRVLDSSLAGAADWRAREENVSLQSQEYHQPLLWKLARTTMISVI